MATSSMRNRRVDVVDLTGTDDIIDLTLDCPDCAAVSRPSAPVSSTILIPWISKHSLSDPSEKRNVARRMIEREAINVSELRKDAAWFEEAELLFKAAMPP